MRLVLSLLIIVLAVTFQSKARFDMFSFDNSQQEQRFRTLITDLRCPTCQNNSLADSNAPLASDIKRYIYQSIKNNKSNQEITDYLISRYGQFISYNPQNHWLWLGVAVIVLTAIVLTAMNIARSRQRKKTHNIPRMESLITHYEHSHTEHKDSKT